MTDDTLDRVHGVMWACEFMGKGEVCWPGHTFQILTKRAARLPVYYGTDRRKLRAKYAVHYGGGNNPDLLWEQVALADHVHPRIQLGVSVENQQAADERVLLLLQTPAAKRFVSAEPLLGPVTLEELPSHGGIGRYLDALSNFRDKHAHVTSGIDWVIVGGESGPKARPMHPDWARSLRDQCVAAGVPFFFKQWGEWAPGAQKADYSTFTRIDVSGNPSNDPTKWAASDALFSRVGNESCRQAVRLSRVERVADSGCKDALMARLGYCQPCGQLGRPVDAVELVEDVPMCRPCAVSAKRASGKPEAMPSDSKLRFRPAEAAAWAAGRLIGDAEQVPPTPPAKRKEEHMDHLVCETIYVADVPRASSEPRRPIGRSGAIWGKLLALPTGRALSIACRDSRHVGTTARVIAVKAKRAKIPVDMVRQPDRLYVWRVEALGGCA